MKISILGAGTWGMALARLLANKGYAVTVWSALEAEIEAYRMGKGNQYLPDMEIPASIVFTGDMEEACTDRDIVLFAVPSVFVRTTAEKAAKYIKNGQIIVDVAKGIEAHTLCTMSEIIQDEFTKAGVEARYVVLSGPTHAEEVAKDLPTTIVSTSADLEAAKIVQDTFNTDRMRVYTNLDSKGAELCGALKNIIALASGISKGMGFGDNARAALLTRGMAEITRLGIKMDCEESTFYGLTGIGDLIVTATSEHSRNNRAGFLIGQGFSVEEAKKKVGMVVEGINAIPSAIELADKYQVEMPLIQAVNRIINEGCDPKEEIEKLMRRTKKME